MTGISIKNKKIIILDNKRFNISYFHSEDCLNEVSSATRK